MSKCLMCGKRKGKRKCNLTGGMVCTECCGDARREEECEGCRFYRHPKELRRYGSVPRFSLEEMDARDLLALYSSSIEGTLCLWDDYHNAALSDESALRVLEMLLDKYHFGDLNSSNADALLQEGFDMVVKAIEEDLPDVPLDTIAKVLGAIYFAAKRRNAGRREYFQLIHEYVGLRLADGTRVLPR